MQRTYFGVLVAAFDAGNSLDFGFETLDLLFVVLRPVEVIQGFLARHVATIRLHKILSTNSPARETKASTLTLRFLVVERFVSYRSRRRKSLFAPDQPWQSSRGISSRPPAPRSLTLPSPARFLRNLSRRLSAIIKICEKIREKLQYFFSPLRSLWVHRLTANCDSTWSDAIGCCWPGMSSPMGPAPFRWLFYFLSSETFSLRRLTVAQEWIFLCNVDWVDANIHPEVAVIRSVLCATLLFRHFQLN